MNILSLDLSTKSTGFCIGQNEELKTSGCITASSKNVIERIIKMRNQLSQIIKNNHIDKIIMEEVRPDYNSHTSKVLMWLQAIVVITAYQINHKIQYQFISTTEWRSILKIKQGRGIKREQLKPLDIQYIKNKYNLIVNDDQADAICIFDAYCKKMNNIISWE